MVLLGKYAQLDQRKHTGGEHEYIREKAYCRLSMGTVLFWAHRFHELVAERNHGANARDNVTSGGYTYCVNHHIGEYLWALQHFGLITSTERKDAFNAPYLRVGGERWWGEYHIQ